MLGPSAPEEKLEFWRGSNPAAHVLFLRPVFTVLLVFLTKSNSEEGRLSQVHDRVSVRSRPPIYTTQLLPRRWWPHSLEGSGRLTGRLFCALLGQQPKLRFLPEAQRGGPKSSRWNVGTGRMAPAAPRPLSRPSPSANLVGIWKGNPPGAPFAPPAIPKQKWTALSKGAGET